MFTAQRAVMRASDGRQIFNGQKTTEKPLLIARKLSTSLLFSVYVPVLAAMVLRAEEQKWIMTKLSQILNSIVIFSAQ